MYRVHSCSIFIFTHNFQTIIRHFPKHCPIIIMGKFNVDILKDNNQTKKKRNNYVSWINSNYNHNLVKTPQKLGFN